MLTVQSLIPWLPASGTAAVCAVSGGLDSMCLLHVLWTWCAGKGVPLTAAHFHHGLRDTADRDEAFVRDWCAVRGIPFTAGRGDVRRHASRNGLSVEEAARNLRYAFLREAAAEQGRRIAGEPDSVKREPCVWIYTAHHAGDNAETVLLNLIRGTGIRGLAGMRRRRDGIVRPFLDVTRAELEEYAAAHGIPHMEDETNRDPTAATRNRVRLELLPLLRALNPRAEEHLRETAGQLSEIDDFLEAEARRRMASASAGRSAASVEIRDGRAVFPLAVLADAPRCVRPRMLLLALDGLGMGRKDFGAAHLDAVLSLAGEDYVEPGGYPESHGDEQERRHGEKRERERHGGGRERHGGGRERRLDLPHGVTARCVRGLLILERRSPKRYPVAAQEAELVPGKPVLWGAYRLTLLFGPPETEGNCILLRNGPERLTVSRVRAGDRLRLEGSSGSRTVKRLCMDRRISLEERDGLPAVYADGRLAAVWRLGTDISFLPADVPFLPADAAFLPADGATCSAGSAGGAERRILVEDGEKKI